MREVVANYSDVTVVAVTKYQPVEKIRTVVQAGFLDLGINHAQQGDELAKLFPAARRHFIGHIQSRKAREILDYHLVQSLDRLKIVEEWQKRWGERPGQRDVLIEVNIGEEAQKSGVLPGNLGAFLASLAAFSFLRVRGLMVMPPFLEPSSRRAPCFQAVRKLFEKNRSTTFNTLSMGTSTDFEVALAEGSTMIRLGTMLFGERAAL
ncbi:MAG: YggS family pyridoxal phosphate-dependent enzyme [Deltaproteobacteria bacterium]|nr:YggS family pyridoxal phosphate-dependent enzyme [Deltaproteobacteria bacterium]MBI3295453.1 YggS family pyridoxal phosphate-dependent enzyme [Deltaproteobacteria bacterium]